MVYDINILTTELADLVGFKTSEGFVMSASLTDAQIKMNNYHPLLQLSNLDNVRPSQITLSDWLIEMRESVITTVLNDLITTKLNTKGIKSKLSDTYVFDSTARQTNLDTPLSRFVGWSFRPIKSENLVHTISQIALQTLEPVTGLTIYIYHSSQKEPIDTRTITTTAASSVNWVELETPINFRFTDYDAGGYYIVGYYQDDLLSASSPTNRAIYKEHDLSKVPCGSCNRWNVNYYKQWGQFMNIDTLYINSTDINGTDLPSTEKINFEGIKNYGLNFKIATTCEITNFLTQNKSLILPTLQVKYAIELLQYINMSPLRKNSVTDTMKNEAFIAIYGTKSENGNIKVEGLIDVYKNYLASLNFDTSLLDPICLAGTRAGITWNKR